MQHLYAARLLQGATGCCCRCIRAARAVCGDLHSVRCQGAVFRASANQTVAVVLHVGDVVCKMLAREVPAL